jgi:hypothetical protein
LLHSHFNEQWPADSVDFSTPRLYILDGGKALHAAVRKHAGEAATLSSARFVICLVEDLLAEWESHRRSAPDVHH